MEGELHLDVKNLHRASIHSQKGAEVEEEIIINVCDANGTRRNVPACSITIEGHCRADASAAVALALPASSDHSNVCYIPTSFNLSPHCISATALEPLNGHLLQETLPFHSDRSMQELTSSVHSAAGPTWLSFLSSGGGRATANSGISFCISRWSLQSPAVDGNRRSLESNIKSAVIRPEPCCADATNALAFTSTQESAKCQVAETRSGMALTFDDVSYRVVKRQRRQCWTGRCLGSCSSSRSAGNVKQILDGITGHVRPGEMLALMGPSGSGKTTLLNLLGGRANAETGVGSSRNGTILYDGAPYTKFLKYRIGFVTQDDVLYPHLTVKETLTYAALLRLPSSMPHNRKSEVADGVIRQLGLEGCRDTVIGNAFLRGVSGGERKRVCIGHEILIDPSLLLLDEPTSGLDSTTALRIISLLKDLAQAGRSVVTTIHQPSSRAFYLFDKLLLLAEGHCVYFGRANSAVQYFEDCGFMPVFPVNPADYLLDLCSGSTSDMNTPLGLMERAGEPDPASAIYKHRVLQFMLERKAKPDGAAAVEKTEETMQLREGSRGSTQQLQVGTVWAVGWASQVHILLERGLKERRHDYLGWLKVTQVMATALLCGALWWHSSSDSLPHLEDQVGLLFFIALFWGFFPLFNAVFTFPMERAMLAKERSSGMYRLSAYFVARSISDLPLDLLLPTCFLTLVYVMTTLRSSFVSFLHTILAVHLTVITAQGVGLLIGATLMDVKKATTLGSVLVIGLMLVAGFFVQHVPKFVAWTKYLSFQSYCYKLLLKIQYSPYYDSGICSGKDATTSTECKKGLALTRALHGMRLRTGADEVWALLALSLLSRLLAYLALHGLRFRFSGSRKKLRHCVCASCCPAFA